MNKSFLDDIPASIFTTTGIVIAFLLINDLTSTEQNNIGNWLEMIGQILITNSNQQELIENKKNTDEIELLNKVKSIINDEINKIKKSE